VQKDYGKWPEASARDSVRHFQELKRQEYLIILSLTRRADMPGSLLKKLITSSLPGNSDSGIAFFPQKIALAKPVAHDKFDFEPFFNKRLALGCG